MRGALRRQQFRFWEGTASMRGAVRGSVKACCRARRGRRARRSLFSSINFLPRTAPRPALWQKQQAQTERSHRRKEEEATRNRFMGVLREKYKRQEEGKGTKRKHQHQKNRSHTFKGASRKPQLKNCKLKQDASTKQKKKTRHEIDLRGFSHEAVYGRFCDGKKMRAN